MVADRPDIQLSLVLTKFTIVTTEGREIHVVISAGIEPVLFTYHLVLPKSNNYVA
jgi:hypothetical protein